VLKEKAKHWMREIENDRITFHRLDTESSVPVTSMYTSTEQSVHTCFNCKYTIRPPTSHDPLLTSQQLTMAKAQDLSRIAALSATISENVSKIDTTLGQAGIPSPSFDGDQPDVEYPEEAQAARVAVIDATHELNELTIGARGILLTYGFPQMMKFAVLRFIYRFKICDKVPVDGEISYDELSNLTGVHASTLRQLLWAAMSYHMFMEKSPGMVSHSSVTKLFMSDTVLQDCAGWTLEDLLPAFMGVTDALLDNPAADNPFKTGYMRGHGADMPSFWQHLSQDPERQRRFHSCMSKAKAGPEWSMEHLTENFPWTSITDKGTVVDVGGGLGDAAFAIAHKAPTLRLVVQDRPEAIKNAGSEEGLNVEFMGVDFFAGQPVKDADVYLFRAILHNWPDSWAIRILKNLTAALKPGAKVLIMDELMPPAHELTLSVERTQR
jgi:hypothetical protein